MNNDGATLPLRPSLFYARLFLEAETCSELKGSRPRAFSAHRTDEAPQHQKGGITATMRKSYSDPVTDPQNPFSNAQAVARYAEDPPRKVPGFADLQRMTRLLLGERVSADARILVLGAGGGLELKAFASSHPNWTFLGVDPSEEMLHLAEQTLGSLMTQVELLRGYIQDVPEEAFDGATCLLTLHFLKEEDRRQTLLEVHRRLKPGAPFVTAHLSFPQEDGDRALWLSRYAAFAADSGLPREKAEGAAAAIDKHLNILTPAQDEALLREAGFSHVSSFYAGFAFRGWVGYA